MTVGARAEVAFACAPAWFVGVVVTVVVAMLFGAAAGNAFDADGWNFAMVILLMGMLLTLPALMFAMGLAFALAPIVSARPLLFGLLFGLSGPAAFLLHGWQARAVLEMALVVSPGIVAAALAFRHLVRRLASGPPAADHASE